MAHEIWMEYDSTVLEWGLPEETLERIAKERGIELKLLGAGTDLQSGQRDVQYAVLSDSLEDVARVIDIVSADGMVSCRLREEE